MEAEISLSAESELKEQITGYILLLHNTTDAKRERQASYLKLFAKP